MSLAIVGELLVDTGTVLVRGKESSRALHSWAGGAFGELLVRDALTGAAVTGPPPSASGHVRRPPGSNVLLLRLRAVEAFFLAFHVQPPRLRVVARAPHPPPHDGDTSFAAAEEATAAAAAAAPALDAAACWAALRQGEPLLPQLYAAYVALRAAGWYIRDGVKFGFDFALYDASAPASRHAPLGALVLARGGEGERNWLWLQRHARVCHSVGKGLLLCSVEEPSSAAAATERGGEEEALVPPRLEVRTVRVDNWDPGRAHASLSER
jgi:hypothetical protein